MLFFNVILKFCVLTEIQRNGGDEKSKNMERNPSNILPGDAFRDIFLHVKRERRVIIFILTPHSTDTCFKPVSRDSSSRWVLHLPALQPVRSPRCLPSVRGRQRSLGEHHGPGPGYHGPEEHPEGLLHSRRHHGHRASAASPWHVRGKTIRIRAMFIYFGAKAFSLLYKWTTRTAL